MYDELVKALRDMSKMGMKYGMAVVKMREAADAIEELNGFVQEAERDRDEYRERLDKANDVIEKLQKHVLKMPHGRLVDADRIGFAMMDAANADQALAMVDDAPIVLEAEDGE